MEKLSPQEVRSFLAEETIFRAAPDVAIERLAEIARQRVVPAGSSLFTMGQACEALYFVVRGCGRLVKGAPDGRQRILHRASSGEMVGAVPFFDGKGFPASFVAETDCVVLGLERDALLGLLGREPGLSLSLIGGVVARLRMMTGKLEQLSFEDTTHRLWAYLVAGSREDGAGEYPRVFEKLPTREQIAGEIGTVREVVSRRLSSLVDSGHLRIEGRSVTLLKPL